MTRVRKRIIAIGLVAVLVLAFAAPAYAYFTDVQRASGAQEVDLNYSAEITEKHEDPEGDLSDKLIAIENTGSSDIMARVFVSDAMAGWTVKAEKISNNWSVENTKGGKLYVYKRVIHPGETSDTLKVVVTKDDASAADRYPDFDVIAVGQTSPVAYDDNNQPYGYAWQSENK